MNGAPRPPCDQAERTRLVSDLVTGFAVGAGAGSGKTRVLVERVLALIDQGIPIEQIVAITFTEKAASELRERIRQGLVRSGQPAPDARVEQRRGEALAGLEVASFTTIHGFCRAILAARPVEAGVSPGFRVLDALEARLLLEQITGPALEELLGSEEPGFEQALLAGLEPAGLLDLVEQLLRYPDLAPRTEAPVAVSAREVLGELHNLAERTLREAGERASGDKLVEQARRVAEQTAPLPAVPADEQEASEILERISFRSNLGARGNWAGQEEVLAELKQAWGQLKERQQEVRGSRSDHALAWALGWARQMAEAFREQKARLGALDFDDLLTITRNLLETDREVAADLRRQYTHLLVDEFQDTDPLQAGIILRLAEAITDYAPGALEVCPGRGRLFLVGDVHQSIYRFRRADLEVFRSVRARVLESGQGVQLRTNFRSRPALVELANEIFPPLLAGDPYEPLEAYRTETTPGPAVHLLDLDVWLADPRPGAETVRRIEARAVAGWLRGRIERERGNLVDPATGQIRPMTYGDVMLLVRTFTGASIYEEEFERAGVPLRVTGGKAYFARSEVHETLAVLTALADPADEAAAVAALRSPYLGVSDEALALWASAGRTFRGRAGLAEEYAADETFDSLPAALDLLGRLQVEARRLSPSRVIRRLWEETRAMPLQALKPDGRRRLANLLKLLEMAASYEEAAATLAELGQEGLPSLGGMAAWLTRQQSAAAEAESELDVESGGEQDGPGTVTLMTIHKAKGLEFPVVVLMDREYRPTFVDQAIPDRQGGQVVVRGAGLSPGDWEEFKEREQQAQQEESNRLLYVAFTRAREQVVLCARRGQQDGDRESDRRFLAPLEQALIERAGRDDGVVVWTVPELPEEQEARAHRLRADWRPPEPESALAAAGRQQEELEVWCGRAEAARRPRLLAASQIGPPHPWSPPPEGGTGAPDERIGLPSWGEQAPGEAGGTEPGAIPRQRRRARLRGSLVHAALRRVVERGEGASEAIGAVLPPGEDADLAEEAGRFVKSGIALLEEARAGGWRPVAGECPLLAWAAGLAEPVPGLPSEVETVVGIADLLLEHPDGRLRVVDYKTDAGPAGDLAERYRGQLVLYRAALAAATGRPVEAELWSLDRGERVPI